MFFKLCKVFGYGATIVGGIAMAIAQMPDLKGSIEDLKADDSEEDDE